jgi:hypothetical protein
MFEHNLGAFDSTKSPLTCAIFCGPASASATSLALSVYRTAKLDIPIELVTPERCRPMVESIAEHFGVSLVMDEQVEGYAEVSDFLREHAQLLHARGRSVGWYLQQYLKMSHAWRAHCPLFVHDGDTVFRPSLLQDIARAPYLLTTRENIAVYSSAASNLGLPTYPLSFIANGGVFLRDALESLGSNPVRWFISAMTKVVLPAIDGADFSEYQIMGALLSKRLPNRPLKIFRRFDLLVADASSDVALSRVNHALDRYDAVAFEALHRAGWFKRFAGRLAYASRRSW